MKRARIAALILLLACGVALLAIWLRRPVAADVSPDEQITVDGATRRYRLVIPHALVRPAPVVFAFHGIGDSPEGMANYSRLDELAARKGFLLVFPAARNSMWRTEDANAENFDANPDVRFFDQLLADLTDRYDIDRSRVYVVGMSNGASFVQILAIVRSEDIAAIVAHSGPKPLGLGSPENRLPVMLIVGADDLASKSMQSDAEQYRAAGHVVEFVVVPGLGHAWSPRHNAAMWEFLAQHASARKH